MNHTANHTSTAPTWSIQLPVVRRRSECHKYFSTTVTGEQSIVDECGSEHRCPAAAEETNTGKESSGIDAMRCEHHVHSGQYICSVVSPLSAVMYCNALIRLRNSDDSCQCDHTTESKVPVLVC